MSYNPTTWATGDIITAEKLNKAEGGIEGAYPLVVTAIHGEDSSTLDKTWAEIFAAHGNIVVVADVEEEAQQFFFVADVSNQGLYYLVRIISINDTGEVFQMKFRSDTEDGVLTLVE